MLLMVRLLGAKSEHSNSVVDIVQSLKAYQSKYQHAIILDAGNRRLQLTVARAMPMASLNINQQFEESSITVAVVLAQNLHSQLRPANPGW